MARRCELTGMGVLAGHNVSHSNIKTPRRFLPNVRHVKLPSEALRRTVKLRISNAALRSVERNDGLDNFLLKQADERLSIAARKLKRQIKKALAARQTAGQAAG